MFKAIKTKMFLTFKKYVQQFKLLVNPPLSYVRYFDFENLSKKSLKNEIILSYLTAREVGWKSWNRGRSVESDEKKIKGLTKKRID